MNGQNNKHNQPAAPTPGAGTGTAPAPIGTSVTLAHGSGGHDSAALMREVFGRHFANPVLDRLEDAAVLPLPDRAVASGSALVVSTDSFVVTPPVFPGGDIGKLAVCGTVNDLLMMGAVPDSLTCGFILEEGLPIGTLASVVQSMAHCAREAGIRIVAGDTKVIERRGGDGLPGLFINTTGIGFLPAGQGQEAPSAARAEPGDAVLVSGTLGDHHACILSARLGIENGIESDCAVLSDITEALRQAGVNVHAYRDVTRGGLATVTNEIAAASGVHIEIDEGSVPVSPSVKGFCGIMGLDPLYMGNEGKLVAIVPGQDAQRALSAMRSTPNGAGATIVGQVVARADGGAPVTVRTRIGGTRRLGMLTGEGLPRIC